MDKCLRCGSNKPGLLICGGCGEGKAFFRFRILNAAAQLNTIFLDYLFQLLIAQKNVRKKVGKKVTKENAKLTSSKIIQ